MHNNRKRKDWQDHVGSREPNSIYFQEDDKSDGQNNEKDFEIISR